VKVAVRSVAELGDDLVLAPERHVVLARASPGVPLGDLVVLRSERVAPADLARAVVLDTTHARDGLLDVGGALRDGAGKETAKSAKKLARAGEIVVSRLRPYLRQIALVHEGAIGSRTLAVSSEFYVLAPKKSGQSIAWLLPFLLGDRAQAALRDAQEGGHHPRVPRASLLALRVPHELVRARARTSREIEASLDDLYRAAVRLRKLLGHSG
jgi:hypothetical protein